MNDKWLLNKLFIYEIKNNCLIFKSPIPGYEVETCIKCIYL